MAAGGPADPAGALPVRGVRREQQTVPDSEAEEFTRKGKTVLAVLFMSGFSADDSKLNIDA